MCGGHKICVVDTKSVRWTENLCGGHKICVGDTKSVWETQNLCGRHKHTLHVTRYMCLRVCWIPRAAPELWFLKDVLDEMKIPRKKLTMPLTKRMFLNQNCFSRLRLWWVGGAQVPDPNPALRAGRRLLNPSSRVCKGVIRHPINKF